MDSDHGDSGGAGAEGLADDLGQALSKLIHDISWPPRRGEDPHDNGWKEVPCRTARVSYRAHFHEDGQFGGLLIECKARRDIAPKARP